MACFIGIQIYQETVLRRKKKKATEIKVGLTMPNFTNP